MIPKIIHYCWFGRGEKSPLIKKCIESWKRYCPDYKIIEWNEYNFNVNINNFTEEAYEAQKYAFVSDYLRLYVLYKYGGIYVDTDLEIKRNIDEFLKNRAFSGFEIENYIPTAIMGAEKGHPWIKSLLDYYKNRSFILENGKFDTTANPRIITEITKEKYDLDLTNVEQVLDDGIHIYPDYVFCNNVIESKNYSEHHFEGSWLGKNYKREYLKFKKNYNILLAIMDRLSRNADLEVSIRNYHAIYIFGSGYLTEYILKYFYTKEYAIDGIITREAKNTIYGEKVISIEELNNLNENDLIIVVPSYDYNVICDELKPITKAQIVSIEYFLGIRIIY